MLNRREFGLRLLVETEIGSFDGSGLDSSFGCETDSARPAASFEPRSWSLSDAEVSGLDLSVRWSIYVRMERLD